MSLFDNNNVTLRGEDGAEINLGGVETPFTSERMRRDTLYARSGAPSKKEVKVESGRNRQARKSRNWAKQNYLLQHQSPPAPPKNQTPRSATIDTGGLEAIIDGEECHPTDPTTPKRKRTSSPFPQSERRRMMYNG
jgi:hypothetical protein